MAESQSLFASCAGLVKASRALYKAVTTTQEQHASIQLLRMEVKILIQVVEKLRDFEDDSLCKAMEATDTRHWKDAKQVLEDCHITVIKLNHLIASPNESRNVLSRAWRSSNETTKSKWNFPAIDLLKKELRLQRDSIHLSTNVIHLYDLCPIPIANYRIFALRRQQRYPGLNSRIDEFLWYIQQRFRTLNQDSQVENVSINATTAERNATVMANLRKSFLSAAAFVGNLNKIRYNLARYEAKHPGSEAGLTEQQKADVESWLSNPLPLPEDDIDNHSVHENNADTVSLSGTTDTEGTDSLHGFYNIKRTRQLATREFRLTNYDEAERHLVDVKAMSDAKYGKRYAWKDETIEMLAVTYSRQSKWVEAEETLKRALKETTGKRETQALQLKHALAEMYLIKGDLDSAETFGRQAVNGRISLLEKQHPSSCQSLYLMVRISYATEDERQFRTDINSLPKGYWTEDCEEIEGLALMDRHEAAHAASMGMLRDILTDEHRGELERVISSGGLTGSGGYSLLHALIDYGEAAPIRVLLEQGADPNASDGDGNTALHLAAALHENAENVVRVLLTHHADVDARTGREGESALIIAVKCGRLNVVQLLVEDGADLEVKDILGYTAIHHAAFQGATNILRYLLKKGAKKDETGCFGRTALHIAASRGYESFVRVLKAEGAKMNIKDRENKLALNLAEIGGHDGTVRILKGMADLQIQEKSKEIQVPSPKQTKLRRRTEQKESDETAIFSQIRG